ncbi:very short patch repair endonuclease [Gordonia rubripertincta]|uniref:very short patch repair endonuclease n=1 Tax=Gordonia rubripertincta TaxID=36822 RepID=UPI000E5C070F|nr:very short patch repair endonuclease [Gordonia rubripertincta]
MRPDDALSPSGGRPPASSESVRFRMSRQRNKDTNPETQVRRALHSRGVRFRTNVKVEPDLRTRADVAWRGLKLAVFIDGCFWHGCPKHATQPAANAEWWAEKLETNRARDRRTDSTLTERGWTVRRYWEHELPEEVADDIVRLLGSLRKRPER